MSSCLVCNVLVVFSADLVLLDLDFRLAPVLDSLTS